MTSTSVTIPDKWIAGLDPAAPVASEIASVLQKRLETVGDRVREVIKTAGSDDEAVHQLRVSTRRAQAVVLSFKSWLRKSRRRRVKKILKRLRGAAGEVRMCDVHRGLLTSDLAGQVEIARLAGECSLARLASEREDALAALVRAAKAVPIKRLRDDADRLIRENCKDGDEDDAEVCAVPQREAASDRSMEECTVRAAGHAALARLAQEFRAAGEADLSHRENLHQLRLAGKRLRYAVEIFGAAEEDPAPLITLAEHLAALQDRLGAVNDHHEVAERLQRYATETAAAIGGAGEGGQAEIGGSILAEALRTLANESESRCNALAGEWLSWWNGDEARGFHDLIDALSGRGAVSTHGAQQADEPERVPEIVVIATNDGAAGDEGDAAAIAAGSGESEGEQERS